MSSVKIHVTTAQRGSANSRTKYRVAWSTDPAVNPASDARSTAFRAAVERGVAGVEYVRGAGERDALVSSLNARSQA